MDLSDMEQNNNCMDINEKSRGIDVSVIIPVYNAASLINRCLDSIFAQSREISLEVILIDDGSTDNSLELIKARTEQNRMVIICQANAGPAAARNKGIAVARGKYLTFIDADDYWFPDFLKSTVCFLDSNPECVGVSVAQKHITMAHTAESPSQWNKITDGKSCVIPDFYKFWGQHKHICTGSILLRSSVAKQSGGMREDLRSCEDLEFWALMASYGKMGYIPQLLFVSDGNFITKSQGWNKYKLRFQHTKDFECWSNRLNTRLSQTQKSDCASIFNSIVLGITRSYISAGKFSLARKNLKYYRGSWTNEKSRSAKLLLNANSSGCIVWGIFATIYLGYRYFKISIPYYREKFGV